MSSLAHHYISYTATRSLEEETGIKHEWWDGVAVAMAGGTLRHAYLIGGVFRELGRSLGEGPCVPLPSDARVRSAVTDVLTYADVTVICGPPVGHPSDPTAATNPTVIVEVLSPSTERRDRGEKRAHYMGIPSVRHILLVTAESPRIEHYQRTDLGWLYTDHHAGEVLHLSAVDAALSVDAVYNGVPPEPEDVLES